MFYASDFKGGFIRDAVLLLLIANLGCYGSSPTTEEGHVRQVEQSEAAPSDPSQNDEKRAGENEIKPQKSELTQSAKIAESNNTAVISVDDLASRNSPPQAKEPGNRVLIAKDFDWSEQSRVKRVWAHLYTRADEHISELISHMDDNRYSVTYTRIRGIRNHTVGDICSSIIYKHIKDFSYNDINVFYRRIHAYQWLRMRRDELRPWIDSHKNMSLLELQLEGLGAIEKEFATNPEYATIKDEHLKRLGSLKLKIQSTQKPILRGEAFHTHDEYDAIRFLSEKEVVTPDE